MPSRAERRHRHRKKRQWEHTADDASKGVIAHDSQDSYAVDAR